VAAKVCKKAEKLNQLSERHGLTKAQLGVILRFMWDFCWRHLEFNETDVIDKDRAIDMALREPEEIERFKRTIFLYNGKINDPN